MRDSSISSADHKRPSQEECCDLYGEYCYPCNAPAASAEDKRKQKKQRKGVVVTPAKNS